MQTILVISREVKTMSSKQKEANLIIEKPVKWARTKKHDSFGWLILSILIIFVLLSMIFNSAGCNTVHGLARDLEGLGRTVREGTQNSVDTGELKQIKSGINRRNRIIEDGNKMREATR